MRHYITFAFLTMLLFMFACTMQPQGSDIRVTPSPIFGGQPWEITRQAVDRGDRICTVSSGGLDVTLVEVNHTKTQQVETSLTMSPGDSFIVLVAGHRYETSGNLFSQSQSAAIIRDLAKGDTLYTELEELEVGTHRRLNRTSNKIALDNFAPQYDACKQFIAKS